MEAKEISKDSALCGKVIINQHKRGYRFSIDAVLLAWYASHLQATNALELGTGSGIISLLLAHKDPNMQLTAVEIQEPLYQLAKLNIEENKANKLNLLHQDLKGLRTGAMLGKYDLVFSNPPFRAVGNGRLNPDPEKAIARHELEAKLEDILQVARHCLKKDGYLAMIILAERQKDLQKLAKIHDFAIVHRLDIHPFEEKPANLQIYLLGNPNATMYGATNLSIWQEVNKYTTAVEAILEGEWEKVDSPLPL